MIYVEEHLRILGLRVTDKVTQFTGVATSVSFDLFGCVQVAVNPGLDSKGELVTGHWFDIARLSVDSPEPVMQLPNFEFGPQAEGRQGAAEKPAMMKP